MATFAEVREEETWALASLLWLVCEPVHPPSLCVCVSEIILPSTYKNAVRGLCGNYDGITRNEYMKPDGTVVRDLNNFGESWRVSERQADGLRIFNLHHTVHAHR